MKEDTLIPVVEEPENKEKSIIRDCHGNSYLKITQEELDSKTLESLEEEYDVKTIGEKGLHSLQDVAKSGRDFAREVEPNSGAVVYSPENKHGGFGDSISKTGNSVVRNYVNRLGGVMGTSVVAEKYAGQNAYQCLSMEDKDLREVPITGSVTDAVEKSEIEPEYFVLGIALPGGGLNGSWEKAIEEAMQMGLDIVTGFHEPLGDRDRWRKKAVSNNVKIYDVRKSPNKSELEVAHGEIDGASEESQMVKTPVILSAGLDSGVGKRTLQNQIANEAEEDGYNVGRIATGQTGIMLGADRGIPADSIPADFLPGAVQNLIIGLENDEKDFDMYVVEGQSAASHPAYGQVTLGIYHGVNPDILVLSHDPDRDSLKIFPEDWDYPDADEELGALEKITRSNREFPEVAAVNIHDIDNQDPDLSMSDKYKSESMVLGDVMKEGSSERLWNGVKAEIDMKDGGGQ